MRRHANDRRTARNRARPKYGDDIQAWEHRLIRQCEACIESIRLAIALARKPGTRLHVLHISSAHELALLEPGPIKYQDGSRKQITAETCVHFLHFDNSDRAWLGVLIKCNPTIKTAADREVIIKALAEGRTDVLAIDHAYTC